MNLAQVQAYLSDATPALRRPRPFRAWASKTVNTLRWLPLAELKRYNIQEYRRVQSERACNAKAKR